MTSKRILFTLMGICLIGALLVAGCTQQAAPKNSPQVIPEPTTLNTQPSVVPTDSPKAQLTQCPEGCRGKPVNPSATQCPEGCRPITEAPTNVPGVGMANPASVNCGKVGASSVIMNNPDGSQYGVCKFPNGTTCEEWALYRGEGCKANVVPAPTDKI
jgi:putative hemolysin